MAVLNDEQAMLRDMAREWVDNEAPVSAYRKMRNAGPAVGFDTTSWGEIGQMGWPGIVVPEQYGGTAFGYLSLGLVLEQMGRNLVAAPLAASAVAATAIAEGGSDAVKEAWLPRIASGEVVAALAIDEGPRHDRRFEASVSGGKLTGHKAFVAEGDSAGVFVVAAADGLYLVDGGAEGVTRSPRRLIDARSHADVRFGGAAAEKLGDTALTDRVCDLAATAAAAEMLGLASQAFETTNAYLKQRVQFGQPLATFQALQHRMAKMFTELELMRSVVEAALEAIDAGRSDLDQAACLAKAVAGETVHLVSREMIQLHGGIGMTDEHDAGFYMKRAQVLETMWGSAAWQRERFARMNGY